MKGLKLLNTICLGSRWARKLKLAQPSGEKLNVGKKRELEVRAMSLFILLGSDKHNQLLFPSLHLPNCIVNDLHRRSNLYNQNRWNQNSNPNNSRKDRKECATIRSELHISKQHPQASRDESHGSRLGKSAGAWHTGDAGSWHPSLPPCQHSPPPVGDCHFFT